MPKTRVGHNNPNARWLVVVGLFEGPVIPAKAGIQSVDSASPKVCEVDSRFRGNDCAF